MAKHQEEQDVLIRQESDSLKTLLQNLPVDYVRRADALRNDAIDKELRDEDRARLTRVEATTLQILENQENRSRR